MIETIAAISAITIIVLGFLAFARWLWERDEILSAITFIFDVVLAIMGMVVIAALVRP